MSEFVRYPAVISPSRLRIPSLCQRAPRRLAAALLLGVIWAHAGPAYGDGAHIALRATSGAYSITLFTAPEPLAAGAADLSVLVQDSSTGEVPGDVTADVTLTRAGSEPLQLALTRAAASNKLLLAAEPSFPAPGSYSLVLHVERPGRAPASFTTVLVVAPDHSRRTILLWALGLPCAVILLFLVNQHAKQRLLVS